MIISSIIEQWNRYLFTYVIQFEKTLHMGFFKIGFDAWLISSSIELTRVQVLGRSRSSCGDTALCL